MEQFIIWGKKLGRSVVCAQLIAIMIFDQQSRKTHLCISKVILVFNFLLGICFVGMYFVTTQVQIVL